MTTPGISVVVTTKDRPSLVANAVSSIWRAAPDAEVIVIDDGSATPAASAVRDLCSVQRVRLIRNEISGGPSYARNCGLAAASRPYCAFLDDDDEWLPNRWTSVRRMLQGYEFPLDLIVVTGFRSIDIEGSEKILLPQVGRPATYTSLADLFAEVRPRVFLNTFVAPTALLRSLGGYDERLHWGEHTDLLIRLAKVARFGGLQEETVLVRVSPTGQGRNWPAKTQGIHLILANHAGDFKEDPRLLGLYRDILGVTQLRAGDRWGAARTFLRLSIAVPGAGQKGRALAKCAAAVMGGRTLWRWIARCGGAVSGRVRSEAS